MEDFRVFIKHYYRIVWSVKNTGSKNPKFARN